MGDNELLSKCSACMTSSSISIEIEYNLLMKLWSPSTQSSRMMSIPQHAVASESENEEQGTKLLDFIIGVPVAARRTVHLYAGPMSR